jgi:Asp-tRNA(Asn)/Glu-tRNA(Gln) amidotransferase A subunit family amidase
MTLAWSLDKLGPLCRGVEDCALVLNALQGPDGRDLTVTDLPFHWDAGLDVRKLRAGYLKAAFDEERATPEEKENDRAALDKLRSMGVELKPISLPDLPIADIMSVMEVEFAAAFDEQTRSHRDDLLAQQGKGSDANLYRVSRFVPAVEYLQATRARTLLMEAMQRVMAEIDVYVAPISSPKTWVPGSLLNLNTTLANLTGQPGIVVRNGYGTAGRPTSMTFTGRVYGEGPMLALAHAYQMATEWHLREPKLG